MTKQQKFSDLKVRTLTAAVLIAILIVFELLHRGLPQLSLLFPLIALIIVARCSYEFVHLSPRESWTENALFASATFLPALFTLFFSGANSARSVAANAPLVLGLGVFGLLLALVAIAYAGRISLAQATSVAHELPIAVIIIGLGGASLESLSLMSDHSLLYWTLLVVIANDTGAYFIGKKFGKTKLSLSLSPGKSIEGLIGGLICGVSVGVALWKLTPIWALWHVGCVALVVGVAGHLFDLGKSFLKRLADVKDSSALLPGHGGVLDRLDGVLGGALAIHLIAAVLV